MKWVIDSVAQLLTWSSGAVQGVGHGKTPSNVLVNTRAHSTPKEINFKSGSVLLLLRSWVSMDIEVHVHLYIIYDTERMTTPTNNVSDKFILQGTVWTACVTQHMRSTSVVD